MYKYKTIDCIGLGERVRAHRKKLHLQNEIGKPIKPTQENLLDYMRQKGLPTFGRNTLSDLENGNEGALGAISLDQMLALCSVFNCSVGHLLGEYDCKNYDLQFIKNELGLSEESIETIKAMDGNQFREKKVLDALMPSKSFHDLLFSLAFIVRCVEWLKLSEEKRYNILKNADKKELFYYVPALFQDYINKERIEEQIETYELKSQKALFKVFQELEGENNG